MAGKNEIVGPTISIPLIAFLAMIVGAVAAGITAFITLQTTVDGRVETVINEMAAKGKLPPGQRGLEGPPGPTALRIFDLAPKLVAGPADPGSISISPQGTDFPLDVPGIPADYRVLGVSWEVVDSVTSIAGDLQHFHTIEVTTDPQNIQRAFLHARAVDDHPSASVRLLVHVLCVPK